MAWDTELARSVTFTVTVSGVVRPHVPGSITWAQDITSDMPAAVTAGGAVAHRSGTVTWAREGLVETRTPSPWYKGGYWIPEVGEPVTIDAHDGRGNTHRVFTGLIDTIEGDAHGNRTSRLVADVQGGDQIVRHGALTRYGSPVPAPTGNGQIRQQATTPIWLVNQICRELGYYSTPPSPSGDKVILNAALQGSTYIYTSAGGSINAETVVSHRPGNTALAPIWAWGPDGFGISNAHLEWVPRTGGGTGAGSVGISMVVFSPHTEDALITVAHGAGEFTYLRVLGNGSVRVSSHMNGVTEARVPATRISGPGPHRISAVIRYGELRTVINGEVENLFLPTPPGQVSRITLDAGAASCVAGVQVWHPSSLADHPTLNWKPTAAFRYGTGTHSTVCTPSVRDRRARDVLEEYADAMLSPLWVDAHGVLQIVTGKGLHEQAPSLTVDALNDVAELSYSMAMLDHRPTVEVSYEHANHANATATSARTTVWQGNGGEVGPGDNDELFVEVPEDEEWIMLSDPADPSRLTFDTRDAFNAGAGTWWGLSEDITAPDYLTLASSGSLIVETMTPWVWKYTTSYPGENGAVQKAPTSAYIKTRYREMDLPIIRSRSKVKYEPRTVSATTTGATYPGTLRHDTGKWITTTQAAADLAQWVRSMIAKATPVLENLVVRFNPEIDVGMKVTIRAKAVFGVDFEALILSVDHRPGDDTTTVTARVTKVTTYAETLNDVDYAHIGQSLAQWDQARAGMTLDQVAADPYVL